MELLISAASSYFFNLLKAVSDPVFVAAADYAGAHGATAIKDALMPKLDSMERKIKDLSLAVYRTSIYHISIAQKLIENWMEELNEEMFEYGQGINMGQTTVSARELPQRILEHINNAYQNAILAYNSHENLKLEYRIRALQVAMLCIWLKNMSSPKEAVIGWKVQFEGLMQDQSIQQCVKYTIGESRMLQMFHKQKKSDLELLAILAHDVISCITSTVQKQNLRRSDTLEFLDHIILPEELDPVCITVIALYGTQIKKFQNLDQQIINLALFIVTFQDLRTKWAQYITWKDYTNGYKLCQEIPFRNDQVYETVAGCCLLNGKLAVVERCGKMTLFNNDLEKVASKEGAYGGIAYDSSNNQLLAWDRVKNVLESLNPLDLSWNNFSIPCPNFGAMENIVSLLVSVTSRGTIVVMPKLKAVVKMDKHSSILQILYPGPVNWMPVIKDRILDGETLFTGLAAIEDAHGELQIAISNDLTCFLLNISSLRIKSFDFVTTEPQAGRNGFHLQNAPFSYSRELATQTSSLDEMIQEGDNNTCVTFYRNAHLIAVDHRKRIYLLKENEEDKKAERLNYQDEERLSGTWIATAHIYIYVTTVSGSVEQRPRFAMQIICEQ